jgi:hypothetical protein
MGDRTSQLQTLLAKRYLDRTKGLGGAYADTADEMMGRSAEWASPEPMPQPSFQENAAESHANKMASLGGQLGDTGNELLARKDEWITDSSPVNAEESPRPPEKPVLLKIRDLLSELGPAPNTADFWNNEEWDNPNWKPIAQVGNDLNREIYDLHNSPDRAWEREVRNMDPPPHTPYGEEELDAAVENYVPASQGDFLAPNKQAPRPTRRSRARAKKLIERRKQKHFEGIDDALKDI